MNDKQTPRCPYCGAEMIPQRESLHMVNGVDFVRCVGCGARGPEIHTDNGVWDGKQSAAIAAAMQRYDKQKKDVPTKDLIDRKEFIRGFSYHAPEERFSPDEVIYLISKAPSVDAVEVRHGKWEHIIPQYPELDYDQCPNCGFTVSRGYGYSKPDGKYCPGCAAIMDTKEE